MLIKRALRRSVAENLSQLSATAIQSQSDANATAIFKLPEFIAARNVAVYLHMEHGEARTDQIIAGVFAEGKRLFLPRIVPLSGEAPQFSGQKTHLRMIHVESQSQIDALEPLGPYKLREPNQGQDCLEFGGLDLIILPAVAYTAACERLGHGKGFYDSFIQEHLQKTGVKPKLVGVGLSPQLVESIPTEMHDERLDAVVIAGHLYK